MARNEDTRSARYCVDGTGIAHLARDVMGWGHDLDCGCFTVEERRRRSLWSLLAQRLAGGL